MRHAVVGAGGIGGLLAGAFARAGREALVLLREPALAEWPGAVTVDSVALGTFEVALEAKGALERTVDVVCIATSGSGIADAISLAPPDQVGSAPVVPLMNGVDHIEFLRERYARVVAAAIWVESHRIGPGRIEQSSKFLRLDVADGRLAREGRDVGIDAEHRRDERSLLWTKLSAVAPIALATTAVAGPVGEARADERFGRCRDEALRVAAAAGADIDTDEVRSFLDRAAARMRSSMQDDAGAGRPVDLDAIAGPILRGGIAFEIPTPATASLVEQIRVRIGKQVIEVGE
jgi:2-dehydropantoate 2-reductase